MVSYRSARSWPPVWISKRGDKYRRIIGEVGILKDLQLSKIEPCRLFILAMEDHDQEYEGILLFEDAIRLPPALRCVSSTSGRAH